jgi:hypothetical protein
LVDKPVVAVEVTPVEKWLGSEAEELRHEPCFGDHIPFGVFRIFGADDLSGLFE